ncbi:MAG TPA: MdtA/MuxA family multidrug efflux RND transporter periplasmic adaptor subunit [Bryobacteraceae bacterium]|nr:MdtA/MuxA family multidrug efflux RND transporter periplasmic adaptor subunit [Bryobacteraceae bacterium]
MQPPGALEPRTTESRPSDPLASHARPTHLPDLDSHGSSSARYWWVWLLIFAAIAYGCYRLYVYENAKQATISAKKGGAMHPHNVPVAAAKAREGDMPVYLQGLGTVTAFNTVTVKPRIDGQLASVNFKEGQYVKQGEVLATIDPQPFQVALDQAIGNLDQAKGTLAKDQAALRDAQVNYVRDQQLFKDQIIAKQQMDTQLSTADQIRGSIEADNAAIAAANAAIASARLNLTYTKITAPIGGRIGLRLVDEGNMVHAADATGLAVIAQIEPIAVLFTIPEDQLPPVLQKLHQGAKMRADAYDRDQKQKLAEGTLLTVDNQIDTTTGTSRLKAIFPNTNGALFPNQFVNVKLWLDTRRNATIIPAVAIQRGPTGTFVYVVNDNQTVSTRPVKIGLQEGNDVSIDDGLQPGESVVIDGAEKLIDGLQVTVRGSGDDSGTGTPGRRKGKRSPQA